MKTPFAVGQLCGKLGMSRQNYYKARQRRQRREADSGLAEQLVRRERAVQPRLGGRKLFHILGPELAEAGVTIGRDRFFEVLKEKGLLLGRLPGAPRATDSRHSLPVFHNLVKGMALDRPNQAWAADITYIRTDEGFLYLSLLTDLPKNRRLSRGRHPGSRGGCPRSGNGAVRTPGGGVPCSPFGPGLPVLLSPVY